MKRLIVDMDGVLADVCGHFIDYEAQETGIKKDKAFLIGKSEEEGIPHIKRYAHSAGFFRSAPVMESSQEILQMCNEAFDLYIVSSAMEFPNSLREKYDWLQEHFSFIHWRQVVLCGDKKAVRGDIMVDDHFKNLDYFEGKTFLFTQPHNQLSSTGRHERVWDWRELWEKLHVLA